MKNIFLNIAALLLISISFAQQVVPIEDRKNFNTNPESIYYYQDVNNELDKFVGTWQYENGNTNFTITFFKVENAPAGRNKEDKLKTAFTLVENGNVVLEATDGTDGSSDRTFYINGGYFDDPNDLNKISILYTEPNMPEKQWAQLYLTYSQNGAIETLEWHVRWRQAIENPNPFKIPMPMTLIKQ